MRKKLKTRLLCSDNTIVFREFLHFIFTRKEVAKFLPYYKFGPNLENYYLATTWRMSWMWHEANLDPCSIVDRKSTR